MSVCLYIVLEIVINKVYLSDLVNLPREFVHKNNVRIFIYTLITCMTKLFSYLVWPTAYISGQIKNAILDVVRHFSQMKIYSANILALTYMYL